MVIRKLSERKDRFGVKRPVVERIFEEEVRYSTFMQKLERTADGGFKFSNKDWDEFDNLMGIEITLTREDVEALKDMITKGLI